jgi:large subunit ribosomal protein L9
MATPIKVVLQRNVDQLGRSGDVVRVRPGFARNFLIPRGLAVPATTGSLARIDELRRAGDARAAQELAEATALKTSLEGKGVTIERVVGEEGKMYGSVTPRDIEEAFQKAGLTIDRKKLELKEPIKELGSFVAPLRILGDVRADLKIEVVKKAGSEKKS